ncbi:unnamed protein product [Chrysoparadoxa australica]
MTGSDRIDSCPPSSEPSRPLLINSKMVNLVVADGANVARALSSRVATMAAEAINERGVFTMALSGGSLPSKLSQLATLDTQWDKWRIFFADERCVALDHEDSNYRQCKEKLFDLITGLDPAHIYPIDPDVSPEECASKYSDLVRAVPPSLCPSNSAYMPTYTSPTSVPKFDCILLGMGPDGHTASLFPGHELLQEMTKSVTHILDSPKPPPSRITLTFPVLNASRCIIFVATGESKAELLGQFFAVEGKGLKMVPGLIYPASMVLPTAGSLTWLVDSAAAAQCGEDVMSKAELVKDT